MYFKMGPKQTAPEAHVVLFRDASCSETVLKAIAAGLQGQNVHASGGAHIGTVIQTHINEERHEVTARIMLQEPAVIDLHSLPREWDLWPGPREG